MKNIKTVLFDYDGVLSKGRFYTTPDPSLTNIGAYANERIFKSEDKLADKWMRGELTKKDINKIIAEGLRIDQNIVDAVLNDSIALMGIDKNLLEYAQRFKAEGKKVGIVTNNMDIFDEVTVHHFKLYDTFSVIVNSWSHGYLKHENNGSLYDVAMKLLGSEYSSSLLIDDSTKARKAFEDKGGITYAYTEFTQFDLWVKSNLL